MYFEKVRVSLVNFFIQPKSFVAGTTGGQSYADMGTQVWAKQNKEKKGGGGGVNNQNQGSETRQKSIFYKSVKLGVKKGHFCLTWSKNVVFLVSIFIVMVAHVYPCHI